MHNTNQSNKNEFLYINHLVYCLETTNKWFLKTIPKKAFIKIYNLKNINLAC